MCNPSTISPLSRTLQMTVYNSATAPTVPSEDRTCYVGANAGLTGYTDWETVFEDQFNVDSWTFVGAAALWEIVPPVAAGTFSLYNNSELEWKTTPPQPTVASFVSAKTFGIGGLPPYMQVPNPVMKTDRPARITFKIRNPGLQYQTITVLAGQIGTGGTTGTPRTLDGTYSEIFPTTGDGVLVMRFMPLTARLVSYFRLEWIVVEQLPSSTVSQGTSISVGLNGQWIRSEEHTS